MTPKEKAEELVQLFIYRRTDYVEIEDAKKCASIAVDEIIAQIEPSVSMDVISSRIKYWQEVKTEIENL